MRNKRRIIAAGRWCQDEGENQCAKVLQLANQSTRYAGLRRLNLGRMVLLPASRFENAELTTAGGDCYSEELVRYALRLSMLRRAAKKKSDNRLARLQL